MIVIVKETLEGKPRQRSENELPVCGSWSKVFPGLADEGYLRNIFGDDLVDRAIKVGVVYRLNGVSR